MNRYLIIFLILLIDSSLLSQVVLENSKIKIVTDGKHISSLYDKTRGLEHVSTDYTSASGLFGVSYVDTSTYATIGTVNSGSITNVTVQSSTLTQASFLLENDILKATVGVKLKDNKPEAEWSVNIELKNPGYGTSQVDFPRFRTPQQYNGTYKRFLEPTVEGLWRSMQNALAYWRLYPATQTLQAGICYFPEGGFMIWADDTTGQVKSFGYITSGSNCNVAVRHYIPFNSNKWEMPYNSRMSLTGSEWQDGADIYREWAEKQYWSETYLRDRKDVPDLLHSPPLVISTQLNLENQSTLPARLKSWADKFGAPVIYRPLGWEKYGNWVGIDYFPCSIGDAAFTSLNASLKATGITVAGFPEPYHWSRSLTNGTTEQNTALTNYFAQNNGEALCRMKPDGTIYTATNENRNVSFLCRGSDFGKSYFQQVARELFDRGVTQMHNDADHMVTLGGPCHNPDHGHPVPYGSWEKETMDTIFREIIQEAKSRNLTDFFLTRENGYETQNMILNGYQARNFHAVSSRRNLIPLYQYIYHDFIPVIYGLATANKIRNIELCALIIYGQIPSIAFWNSTAKEPLTNIIDQSTVDVLKGFYDLMKSFGKKYLLYGKMQRPAITSSPGTLHTTWADEDGNTAVFAIDTLDSGTTLTVKVPGTSYRSMKTYIDTTLQSEVSVTSGQTLSWSIPGWRICSLVFSELPAGTEKRKPVSDHIRVYPNPFMNEIRIDSDKYLTGWEVRLWDITGHEILKCHNSSQINLGNLREGMYLLDFRSDETNSVHKIIKKY